MEKEKSLFVYEVCFFDGKEVLKVPVSATSYTADDGCLHLFKNFEQICSFKNYIYVKRLEPKPAQPPSDFTNIQLQLLKKNRNK